MIANEPLPASADAHTSPAVKSNDDFDDRWAAWILRGQIHDRLMRRRFIVWAGVLALSASVCYGWLLS